MYVCLALSACASPRWVNPQNPGADLAADTAACDKDAERVGRLNQLASQSLNSCMPGVNCAAFAESQRTHVAAQAVNARKRCMASRGWRPLS